MYHAVSYTECNCIQTHFQKLKSRTLILSDAGPSGSHSRGKRLMHRILQARDLSCPSPAVDSNARGSEFVVIRFYEEMVAIKAITKWCRQTAYVSQLLHHESITTSQD